MIDFLRTEGLFSVFFSVRAASVTHGCVSAVLCMDKSEPLFLLLPALHQANLAILST